MQKNNSRKVVEAVLAASLVTFAFAACSSSSSPNPPATTDAGAVSPTSLSFAFHTEAGLETHWCQYIRLPKWPSPQEMLTGYRWKQDAMHHWAFYRTTPDLPKDVD